MSKEIDKEIIERIKNGDVNAFELLVSKYQSRLTSFLYGLLNSPNDVPDAVQETFINAYRGLNNFRNESQFYTWLYRIASNVAYNIREKQKKRPPTEGIDAEEEYYLDDSGELQDYYFNPEENMISQEIEKKMNTILNNLPSNLKDPLMLKEHYDYSYEEIAYILGIEVNVVRSRIFRARQKLKEALDKLENKQNNN